MEQALTEFRPNAVPFEQLKPADTVKLQWEDVGGLNDVKKILIEAFIWPTKVRILFGFIFVYHFFYLGKYDSI